MPKYQILRMETIGTPPMMYAGKPIIYDDPQDAAKWAKVYAKQIGEKLCVKPIIDEAWRQREMTRFANNEYRYLPWVIRREAWWNSDTAYAIHKDHYAHASLEKPGFIAYTKSPEDGAKDKQSLLRPGAYLSRYFEKVLHDFGISEKILVDDFMTMYGPIEVKFAETAEDIVKVYTRGPQTCLRKDKFWPKAIHPASVYAAGDLQVAYIGNIDGKVSARTVVWPDKKLHSRVYGDIARLTQGLQRLDYKWGAPIGAKLKRIQLGPTTMDQGDIPNACFLVPYLDKKNQQGGGHLSVKDMGDHLVICPEGEPGSHHAGGPDGYSGNYTPLDGEYPKFQCERCEEEERIKEMRTVRVSDPDDGDERQNWCRNCAEEHTWCCGYSGDLFVEEVDSVEVDGDMWAKYYADMYAKQCEVTGEFTRNAFKVEYPDGTSKILSQRYIDKHTVGVFRSMLTNRLHFNSERTYVYTDNWFAKAYAAKSELIRRAFQCDGCDHNFLIDLRNQTHGDDRLFCLACHEKIKGGKDVMSPSRKKFEEDRKQLPLIAAE